MEKSIFKSAVMDVAALKKKFTDIYGGSENDLRVFSAASRVNLIGEHVDYNGGPVFPAALGLACVIVARKNPDGNKIRLAATTISEKATLEIAKLHSYRHLSWGNYQAGMLYMMKKEGYHIAPCDLLYHSNIPFGSGLSSSAAIEMSTAYAFAIFDREETGAPEKAIDYIGLAKLGQKCENEYCGVNCGIMDQFASIMGKKDHAILLDCATLQYSYVPFKLKGYSLIVMSSNKKRALAEGNYNKRREECEQAFKVLLTRLPHIKCLKDVSPADFEEYKNLLPEPQRSRAQHVVYECDRVIRSVAALKAGNLKEFGELLYASHMSLKDLYEVTGKELDCLVLTSRETDGCIGARMTGAGFGGCAFALVETGKAEAFAERVSAVYEKEIGYKADFYNLSIENGVFEL